MTTKKYKNSSITKLRHGINKEAYVALAKKKNTTSNGKKQFFSTKIQKETSMWSVKTKISMMLPNTSPRGVKRLLSVALSRKKCTTRCVKSRWQTTSMFQKHGKNLNRTNSHKRAKKSGARRIQERRMSYQQEWLESWIKWWSEVLSAPSKKMPRAVTRVALIPCLILNLSKSQLKKTKNLINHNMDKISKKLLLSLQETILQSNVLREKSQNSSLQCKISLKLHGHSSPSSRTRLIQISDSSLIRYFSQASLQQFLSLSLFPKDNSSSSSFSLSILTNSRNLIIRRLLDAVKSNLPSFHLLTLLTCNRFKKVRDHSATLSKFLNWVIKKGFHKILIQWL